MSQDALKQSPGFVPLIHFTAFAELCAKNYDQAKTLSEKLIASAPYLPGNIPLGVISEDYDASLGIIALKTGSKTEATKFFERSLQVNKEAIDEGNELYQYQYNLAALYAIQGSKDGAYSWLQKAIDAGWRLYRIAQIDPFFENLRGEKEFQQMMASVKTMVDEERRKVEEWEKDETLK